jgi:hypothetical protein
MIPAGQGRHRAHFATPDMTSAACTSSRVTWGGGECLDDAGELVRSCPRHAPVMYATLDARHRGERPGESRRFVLDRWTTAVDRAARAFLRDHHREDYTLA